MTIIRFAVEDDAEHSCCNSASIIDMTKPVMIGGKHFENKYEVICEVRETEWAHKIAEIMNKDLAS